MPDTPAPPLSIPRSPLYHAAPWLATIAITAATVVALRLLGRIWWCEGAPGSNPGEVEPFLWSGNVNSMHNSQHLLDAYSFSHLLHGLIFAGVFFLIAPLRRQRFAWRLSLAILIEAGWEVFENTPFTINRYREATMALGYTGDSIGNSLGDLACCALGFVIATYLRWYGSVAIFLGVELTMLYLIRDNLTLNVLMLIYPINAIQQWQTGM